MALVVADTDQLRRDGLISEQAALEIETRSRAAMMTLAIQLILGLSVLAVAGGLVAWLESATAVAVIGALALVGGLVLLDRGPESLAIFGNAAALIGAGMVLGGGTVELLEQARDTTGPILTGAGALVGGLGAWGLTRPWRSTRVVLGAIVLMGLALHLLGLALVLWDAGITGGPKAVFYLYAAVLIALAGWFLDVRVVTALAIVPFAQILETGTGYFHAAYVFYSEESTLTILMMGGLLALLWKTAFARPERDARHGRILSLMAFIVANLSALVGTLFGDIVGDTVWGPDSGSIRAQGGTWEDYLSARTAFRETALFIPAEAFSIAWAVVLAGLLVWCARRQQRGLFNATTTFAVIHAYTQLFESFGDHPLAYVIGGLGAIPLAWGMWRLNKAWMARDREEKP